MPTQSPLRHFIPKLLPSVQTAVAHAVPGSDRLARRPLTIAWAVMVTGFAASICGSGTSVAWGDAPSSWNRFHGTDGHGYSTDGNIPSTWTDSDYTWRRNLGSRDVSSPIVQGDSIYMLVSHPKQQKIAVESLDLATGKPRWSESFDQIPHHLHQRNTLASSTPVADEDFVFAAWADADHTMLKCFDHDGAEVWSRDFGAWQSQHGFGTSPAIIGDMVVLFNSQQGEQLQPGQRPGSSRMIAVDRRTGATRWETPLTTTRTCYGVPATFQQDAKPTQIIATNTGNGMFGIDPSNGKMTWSIPVMEQRSCMTPIIVGDIALGSSGSGGGGNNQLVAVRIPTTPGAQPQELYRIRRNAPYVPTPVVKDSRLFTVDDRGIAQCLQVETGEVLWTKRIGGNYGASPIIVGDKMLMISLDGKATLIQAADEFKKLGEVDLSGPVGATPAYVGGKLLIRVDNELRCLGGKTL
ncbi:outer membrane biogenesis protein BamB [Rubripirellula lacrimiformis]|uniref:Outer membrane biogenesis protein BamB n=1 Tax=Rubripirellula lacrimiformis TaxID=1930273 RepID=A0A517NBA8_9BACT|nr:PQQ-binding-like beta-propeller repeat protein [Rubripirellula lacrimiformis]QDT04427.1 outer membrane biogenesis protein BamB [Rubripirellula lacrimiformis]